MKTVFCLIAAGSFLTIPVLSGGWIDCPYSKKDSVPENSTEKVKKTESVTDQ